MFVQTVLPVRDEARFAAVKAALELLFAPSNVEGFFKQVQRSRMRVRDFEGMLGRGMLGKSTPTAYQALEDSDRGQARELFLSLVERVAPELRSKFLKIYAYY